MINSVEQISNYIPSNYFITKSMELTRDRTSGTLWFTKKFIVYYTYIFLKNDFVYREQAEQISNIFEDYINSMPKTIRPSAQAFFFPRKGVNNPRSPKFRLFDSFAGSMDFESSSQKQDFYLLAKKYYFAFLMETGGQGKLNSHIKESIFKEDFNMTQINDVINSFYGGKAKDLPRRINDYMSSLRNERQVLYYYGFFHSKSSGANLKEFSSLSSIGELALKANYSELIALWEHQKMKMISQPVTIQLDKEYLLGKSFDVNLFCINRNPYYTITAWLDKKQYMNLAEYKYLVSRLHSPVSDHRVIEDLLSHLNNAIIKVESFHRKSESRTKNEDFSKELKKYILGIRSDLKLDKSFSPLGMVSYTRSKIFVKEKEMLNTLNRINKIVAEYKTSLYSDIFDRCEQELRKQYTARQKNERYDIDLSVKIAWDMYIMKVDVPIMLLSMLLVCDKGANKLFNIDHPKSVGKVLSTEMPNIMKYLGLTNSDNRSSVLIKLKESIINKDFSAFDEHDNSTFIPLVSKYIAESASDLETRVLEESKQPTVMDGIKKKRNVNLINVLKAYNIKCYGTTSPLHCECCGGDTFITRSDEIYLEYHHLIPFNEQDGPDHYLNLFALCPLCHRKIHFVNNSMREAIYSSLSKNNYRKMSIDSRLENLKKDGVLKSYHLDYMYNEKAISKETYELLSTAS